MNLALYFSSTSYGDGRGGCLVFLVYRTFLYFYCTLEFATLFIFYAGDNAQLKNVGILLEDCTALLLFKMFLIMQNQEGLV